MNDIFGHPVGDIVLKEFAVLLQDSDLDAAQIWAERVRDRVAETRYNAANPLRLTVSVGLAELDETQTTSDAVTRLADLALYEAKRGEYRKVWGSQILTISRVLISIHIDALRLADINKMRSWCPTLCGTLPDVRILLENGMSRDIGRKLMHANARLSA